jgi:hypothetical protein
MRYADESACTFRQQISDIEPPITWAILGILVFGTSVIIFNQFANNIDWCVQHDDSCAALLILMLIGCSAYVIPQQLAAWVLSTWQACTNVRHTHTHAHRYYTLIAVILTYFMVMVACRAKGETDYSPTGATAKIPQLVIGAMNPESAASNILAGAVTAGSAVCWSPTALTTIGCAMVGMDAVLCSATCFAAWCSARQIAIRPRSLTRRAAILP